MGFRVSVLGCGSAFPLPGRYASSQLVEADGNYLLLDCGEGAQLQLRRFGLKMQRIQHVLISHLHGDHVFGLPGLLSTFNLLGRKSDLHIYAHAELRKPLMQNVYAFMHELTYRIEFHTLSKTEKQLVFEDRKWEVFSFPLVHRIPVCGFLIGQKPAQPHLRKMVRERYNIPLQQIALIKEGADFTTLSGEVIPNSELTLPASSPSSYAYCTDTIALPEAIGYYSGATLLYHEATFLESDRSLAEATYHATAAEAARLASAAGVSSLLLGHYSARYPDTAPLLDEAKAIFPNVTAAKDGLQLDIAKGEVTVFPATAKGEVAVQLPE
ncbi:MAG: ribonuclease Z [Bacteroidales bacterium]